MTLPTYRGGASANTPDAADNRMQPRCGQSRPLWRCSMAARDARARRNLKSRMRRVSRARPTRRRTPKRRKRGCVAPCYQQYCSALSKTLSIVADNHEQRCLNKIVASCFSNNP